MTYCIDLFLIIPFISSKHNCHYHHTIESLSPVQCRCHNPCEAISYSVESITQALKSPLLFTHSLSLFTKINQTNFQSNNNFQLLTDQQQFNNKIISKNQKLTTVSDDISDYDSNNNNHKNSKELNINQSEQFLHIYRKEIWVSYCFVLEITLSNHFYR